MWMGLLFHVAVQSHASHGTTNATPSGGEHSSHSPKTTLLPTSPPTAIVMQEKVTHS
jgi:hypothetical protein